MHHEVTIHYYRPEHRVGASTIGLEQDKLCKHIVQIEERQRTYRLLGNGLQGGICGSLAYLDT